MPRMHVFLEKVEVEELSMGDTFIVDTFIVWFGLLTLHSVIFGEIT